MSFPTLDQSLPWTKKTNRTLENELSNTRSVVALNQGNESNSWKWAFQHSISRCPEPRKRIELLKMSFPTLDQSLPWTKKTNRTLENELSNTRSVVALNQENESNSWKWAYQHSISRCPEPRKRIELLKMSFPTLDQSLPWTKKTNRTLENELTNIRSVVALNQENESNSWKWAFQHSISRCFEPRKRIELLKMSFPTLDQSLPWTKKTNRTLENELSNIRSVVALNQENESNSWKWAFQHSISRCPEPRKRIELLKMSFPTFDQSLPWTKKTNRTLENELSNTRSVVALNHAVLESPFSRVRFVSLVQGNDWSSVGKLIFKSSIRFLGSGQRLIECWKAHFQEFDSFSWFKATTEENESNSWKWAFQHSISRCPEPSNVGKLIFKSSIRFIGSGQRLIECWKAHFQEFDSFSWFRATTDRVLESSFSRVRFVFLVQGNDWRKRIELLKMSFPTLDQSLPWTIECWKAHFQEFDSFSWFRARTDQMLESSFSRVRFVLLVQGNDWSSVGKLIFKSSIRFLGSGQRLIECWKAHFQVFDSFSWFKATTDRMLESSFSRVRFVFLVQGNDWSSVGKLIFKSSIRFLGSGQRLKKTNRTLENELSNIRSVVALNHRVLESSFSRVRFVYWFRATTDRVLVSSFSRVRFVFLVQGNDWSNVGKLIFKSSIRFLGSGQRLIECWKAHFQEFDSFSWFRAKTNQMLESSFSRVRFVFLVQGNDWSSVGKLIFKSSIRFLGSGQRLKKTNRTLENELSNIWFSRVRFVFLVQGNDWSSVGKLNFKSSIRFLGSGQRLIECWKAHFQEFDSFSWFRATTEENESNSWNWAFQHSISRCPEPRKRIELLKMSFPTFDQSLPWTKKTNRTLENELSNIRSVVALNQENESKSWKWAFQHSISRCPEPRKRIELLKMSLPTLDQSLPWTIECWKAHFQEFDSFSWFRARTDRMLESSFSRVRFVYWFRATTDWMLKRSFSRVRFVFLVQGNDWSNVGKLIFKSSIRFLGSGQRLIECW